MRLVVKATSHHSNAPVADEAESVDEFAQRARLGGTLVYRALNEDTDYRKGLPFLPSLKIGKLRRIRTVTGNEWLASLENRAA